MQHIISSASSFIFILVIIVLITQGHHKVSGIESARLFTFCTILFTTGLDAGLLMLPLTEFTIYADINASPQYAFTNPLALEFGFWGFIVWSFYFLTTYYFIKIEPILKIFEIKWIKLLNNITIICTCSFTVALFLQNISQFYLKNLEAIYIYFIIFSIILFSILSSTKFIFIKILSITSSILFIILAIMMWLNSNVGLKGLGEQTLLLMDYFPNIYHFILPIDSYHEFYIMWWFCWSIMIGQFVAKFVPKNITIITLFITMLVVPSIMLAIWFIVIYSFFLNNIVINEQWTFTMVIIGTLFVVNSLDSLIRLYTSNLNLDINTKGMNFYILFNVLVIMFFVCLYQLSSNIFETIKYIGLAVLMIYSFALIKIIKNRKQIIKR